MELVSNTFKITFDKLGYNNQFFIMVQVVTVSLLFTLKIWPYLWLKSSKNHHLNVIYLQSTIIKILNKKN